MATIDYAVLNPTKLTPVVGPEKDVYLRLVYGTVSNPFNGLTAGRFYDQRALPVPFSKFDPTWFQFDFIDQALDGLVVEAVVKREAPVFDGASSRISVTLSYPTTIFSLRLGKGANDITLVTSNGYELARCPVVATRYASYFQALASEIYTNSWQRLQSLGTSIYGTNPTALTAPLLGFDDQLPHPPNVNQIARLLAVQSIMNYLGSTAGVDAMSQATLGFSPMYSKATPHWLEDSWIDGARSHADQMNGLIIDLWSPNAISGRWSNFVRLSSNSGFDVRAFSSSVEVDGVLHDFAELDEPIVREYDEIVEWLEIVEQTEENDFEFWPHSRSHGFIQAPGLYDYERSYYDTQSMFDGGHELDQIGKSLDPVRNGNIGTAITPSPIFWIEDTVPMGVLSVSSATFDFCRETYLVSGNDVELLDWVNDFTRFLFDTTIFNANVTLNIPDVPASPSQLADASIGLYLQVNDLTAGHTHLSLTLTKGQRAAIKAGTPLSILSQNPSSSSVAPHRHLLTISWKDGWLVSVSNNHGHSISMTET